MGAIEVIRHQQLGPVQDLDKHHPTPQTQRRLQRIRQPGLHVGADDRPVDHDVNPRVALAFQPGRRLQVHDLTVYPGPHESGAQRVGEHPRVAVRPARDRGQQKQPGALLLLHYPIHHLLNRVTPHRPPAVRAMGLPGPREQQPQIVVHLGDRADRRARIPRDSALIDRNRRRQPFDMVRIRLLQLTQELSRVRRKRLDVATLAFGEQRVERQAGFSRTGYPGDHHEAIARNVHIDAPQIVHPRAPHAYVRGLGRWLPRHGPAAVGCSFRHSRLYFPLSRRSCRRSTSRLTRRATTFYFLISPSHSWWAPA